MADVPSALKDWSATASSNSPTDATTIGAGLADNLQALQAVVRGDLATKGSDIGSSSAPDVTAVQGLYHDLTGANTVTGLGSGSAGIWKILQTDSTPVFKHNTALAMPGSADYSATTGDVLAFMCEASNQWRCFNIQRASGEEVKLGANGVAIAAGATLDLDSSVGWALDVTGNASVSAATLSAGRTRLVRFSGAPPLIHGASFDLPSQATIQAAAGDIAVFRGYAGSVVRCVSYSRADGRAFGSIQLGTPIATTSGTSHDFTIPAGVREITFAFKGVSTTGTSIPIIQIGDSGGIETTGYLGSAMTISTAGRFTDGFGLRNSWGATTVIHGSLKLTLLDSSTNTWVAIGIIGQSDADGIALTGGSKDLSGELTQIRLTTQGGTDTFDAGKVNITYLR